MSASTSRKRKNQPVEKSSGPRPSVFDRLGTKANQQQSDARSNFCHHWRNTGNCPFGASCKNASFHALISPSKRAKGGEKEQLSKELINRKEGPRSKKGKGEVWSELDEGELERRRLQLQKELELQNRQEMKKKSNKKQQKRSSSSSSTSSTQSSSNTSKNSSLKSNQPKGRRPRNRKRKGKPAGGGPIKQIKEAELKRMRENPKDNKKRSNSGNRQDQRSRSKHGNSGAGSASKKRKNSTSSDNSSTERRRQQNKPSSHQSKGKGRSPSPDKKKKQPPASYDKKSPARRRDSPVSRRISPGRSGNRKRSVSPAAPRSRRRTPSPRSKMDKKHDLKNNSPPPSRHRSPSLDKKESRRVQTPPSPHDRGHQRSGRNSRRNSPESHRGQQRDSRNRPQVARSPDRRNQGPPREPRESGDKRDFSRRDYISPAPARAHISSRMSPDNAVRPSSRDRRDDSTRDKNRSIKESEKRREGGQDKSRDRGRGRDDELPSLLTMMTQHPAQYSPRRGREEPPEHRSSARDRGRYEDRSETFAQAEDHQRGAKRSSRRESPSRQRTQKGGRDWTDHPEQRDKDWDRRGKTGGNSSHRDWDDQSRQRSSGKGGHKRGQSPPAASPKLPRDLESVRTGEEVKPEEKIEDKKAEKQVDDEGGEPQSKKVCLEGDEAAGSQTGKVVDRVESDFSDFSDDDDDILNADVVEDEPADLLDAEDKAESALAGAEGDKEDEEPVEDMLDDMDFEEISDGELDAEDIKAGADALSVDWAALLTQTRQVKREESETFVNRWDINRALSRIGVPQSLNGSFHLLKNLQGQDKENKVKIEEGANIIVFDKELKLEDEVPGVHAGIVRKKEDIADILNPKHHRGIDSAYGERLRKMCPFKKDKADVEPAAAPYLQQLAVDMLKDKLDLKEVQLRLNIDAAAAIDIKS